MTAAVHVTCMQHTRYVHVTRVCSDACRILMIKREWGTKILNREKTIEVRAMANYKHCGKRVGLCFNGSGGHVFGFVTFNSNIKFDQKTWEEEQRRHRCREAKLPYGKGTWGWTCADDAKWLASPVQIKRRRGAQIFQLLKGGIASQLLRADE